MDKKFADIKNYVLEKAIKNLMKKMQFIKIQKKRNNRNQMKFFIRNKKKVIILRELIEIHRIKKNYQRNKKLSHFVIKKVKIVKNLPFKKILFLVNLVVNDVKCGCNCNFFVELKN